MKTAIFIAFIVTILIVAWYFLWYKPGQNAPLTGTCTTIGGLPGTFQNGICVGITSTNPDIFPVKPKIF